MEPELQVKDRKILIVSAHPDDETLWFYGGITDLMKTNTVEILSVTFSEVSNRGLELINLGKSLGLKIHFGDCVDRGISRLLKQRIVNRVVQNFLSSNQFDLIITHPPHGGEKPHPHHIQVFDSVKKECEDKKIQFGFYSEQKIIECTSPFKVCRLNIKKKNFIQHRLKGSFQLLKDENWLNRISFFLKASIQLWFEFKFYVQFEFQPDVQKKQSALQLFSSQLEFLRTYNSYSKKHEYLYLQKR